MNNQTRLRAIFWIRVVIILIFGFFVVVGLYYAYEYVFEPAYASVVGACEIKSSISDQYYTAGYYVPSTNQIYVMIPLRYDNSWEDRNRYMESEEYLRIVRHERCHRNQAEQGRLNNYCDELVKFWFDEVECYVSQDSTLP